MRTYLLITCIVIVLVAGCGIREREEQLNKKEAALNHMQEELFLKEKTLQLKEQELSKKEQQIDSALHSDTTGTNNPALTGQWAVKMTCTETTCAGSAVGDTKNEQWDISYQANQLVVKAMAGNQLARVYFGTYKDNTIELMESRDTTLAPSSAQMRVRLRMVTETSLEGTREIIRDEGCKIVYALEMQKQK